MNKINNNTTTEFGYDTLVKALSLTIKEDNTNKVVTFLCMLSTYTESSQFNISYNAPSSSGKSYIPLELSSLFPTEDIIKLAYATPTSFYYTGKFDKELNARLVDLSRKVIIFLDQPHNDLLAKLRPLLSHDEKIIRAAVTNKARNAGNRTEEVLIKGYPSVIFCTAGLRIDEQESTRMILLSPELSEKKIKSAIEERIKKASNTAIYAEQVTQNKERNSLIEHIKYIKEQNINEICIEDIEEVESLFTLDKKTFKPRDSRDVGKFISLIKAFAILNILHRQRIDKVIYANEADINNAWRLWKELSISENYGLPPYVYMLYTDIILPTFFTYKEKDSSVKGISKWDIAKSHKDKFGTILPDWKLRQEILPSLEIAGLLITEKIGNKLIYYPPHNSQDSEYTGGSKE